VSKIQPRGCEKHQSAPPSVGANVTLWESMTMCGVFSGRSVLGMAGCNVACQARIPALELWPKGAVECPRAYLEQ
jgi:hypothetical protein